MKLSTVDKTLVMSCSEISIVTEDFETQARITGQLHKLTMFLWHCRWNGFVSKSVFTSVPGSHKQKAKIRYSAEAALINSDPAAVTEDVRMIREWPHFLSALSGMFGMIR